MSVDPKALQAQLQNLLRASGAAKTVDLPLPKFEGRLWATYRYVDWAEQKTIAKPNQHMPASEQEVSNYADTLLAACTTVFARLPDGAKHDLGIRLGRSLAEYLGQDVEGVSDRQALFLLFTPRQIIAHGLAFTAWLDGQASAEVEDEAVQDFEGAGS